MVHVSEKLRTLQPQIITVNLISPGGEQFKVISSALPLICEDDSAVCGAQVAPGESPACYAQQRVSAPGGSEDWRAESSETDSWSRQQPQREEAEDYAIILQATVETEGPCGTDMSPYKSQVNTTEPRQPEEMDDEEVQIFLDWSPDTPELKIPLVSLLCVEDREQTDTETERDEMMLLPKVMLRQCSEESSELEDDFTKMERTWGLIIHANPE